MVSEEGEAHVVLSEHLIEVVRHIGHCQDGEDLGIDVPDNIIIILIMSDILLHLSRVRFVEVTASVRTGPIFLLYS